MPVQIHHSASAWLGPSEGSGWPNAAKGTERQSLGEAAPAARMSAGEKFRVYLLRDFLKIYYIIINSNSIK